MITIKPEEYPYFERMADACATVYGLRLKPLREVLKLPEVFDRVRFLNFDESTASDMLSAIEPAYRQSLLHPTDSGDEYPVRHIKTIAHQLQDRIAMERFLAEERSDT